MIVVAVLYPKTHDSHFDFTYYLEKHTPLVRARFTPLGMESMQFLRGTALLDGGAAKFAMIAQLHFPSLQKLHEALAQHGTEIMADIPNFTNVQPIIQVNEPIE